MNIPGFTAERSLKEQSRASQRSTARAVESVGGVRPQFFRELIMAAAGRCCIEGTKGCCSLLGHLLADSLGSR